MSYSEHPQALLLTLTRGLFNLGGIHSAQPEVARAYRLAGAALSTTLDFETSERGLCEAYRITYRRLIGHADQGELLALKRAILDLIEGKEVTAPSMDAWGPLSYIRVRLGRAPEAMGVMAVEDDWRGPKN